MRYYKFPKWSRMFYPGAIWDFYSTKEKVIYLTFDDGPNPESTSWILDLLYRNNAKATFFCLGNNVQKHPELFEKIIKEGHAVGHHTMSHLDGWKTPTKIYIPDVKKADSIFKSKLFRPPYGRLKPRQFKGLKQLGFDIVFWSLMPYDFDATLNSNERIQVLRENVKPGSIIVFHDSEKAFPQLQNELPLLIKEWAKAGYSFKKIEI